MGDVLAGAEHLRAGRLQLYASFQSHDEPGSLRGIGSTLDVSDNVLF